MEERMELGVAAAPGSSSSGLGVGPVGGALDAGPGSAGLAGIQEESGVRRDGSGTEADPDAPPKKRVRQQEGEAGKLEERLYSVLCCTVCLDLPKASVYQVNKAIMELTVQKILMHDVGLHNLAASCWNANRYVIIVMTQRGLSFCHCDCIY